MSSARGNQQHRSHHFQKKNAREQRLQFMNSQAALIAQKKKEIEEKLALKEAASTTPQKSKTEEVASQPAPSAEPPKPSMVFKNDGSFLEQFLQHQRAIQNSKPSSGLSSIPLTSPAVPTPEDANLPPSASIPSQSEVETEPISSQTIKDEIKQERRSPSPYSPSRPCEDDDEDQPSFNVTSKESVKHISTQPGPSYSSPPLPSPPPVEENLTGRNEHSEFDMKRKFKEEPDSDPVYHGDDEEENRMRERERERKRQSRWGPQQTAVKVENPQPSSVSSPLPSSSFSYQGQPSSSSVLARSAVLSRITTADPQILTYAFRVFGTTDLTEDQWKQCMDQVKMQYIYCEMLRKKQERERLESAGRVKYEYDSDEETEGGTWEHKRRMAEMEKTREWADQLTMNGRGKHHLGDFLPPEELNKFMQKFQAVQEGRPVADESDYQEFKIAESNVGYQMLKKFGWTEGQGLGLDGSGITAPVNATRRNESQGLGAVKPEELTTNDDEYDAYRKRMMLAYRFRPNPLNNPRRPYY